MRRPTAGDLGTDTRSGTGRAVELEAPVERLDAIGKSTESGAPPQVCSADAVIDQHMPFTRTTRTLASDACAYLATFVRASAARFPNSPEACRNVCEQLI